MAELENQIANYESTIQEYKTQGKTLNKEISSLGAKINKLNLQIKSINITLSRLDSEISENKKEIKITENKISVNKEALTKFLRQIYENDRFGLMAVLLGSPKLSDFFGDLNNSMAIQEDLVAAVNKITELRDELIEETETLALKRSDQADLKAYQDSQRLTLGATKKEKANLLDITKGQESKFQSILKETKKTAAEIRKRIFQFFGGGEMSFEEAYQLARLASQATGVRAPFILAILDKESALGQNVGKCPYQGAMHPTRDLPVFLALIAKLKEAGIAPPEPILVSCANRDGAYGGGKGAGQVIPSTSEIY